MDPIVEKLRDYGHQHNPTIRGRLEHIPEDEWERMDLSSTCGQMLLASFQQMMAPEHDALCRQVHGRGAHFDGEYGPATSALFTIPRCGFPDYLPVETEAATGRGSWRVGCVGEHPTIHAVYHHVNLSGATSEIRGWWDASYSRVRKAYADIGLLIVPTDSKSNAQVHSEFRSLGGSTIGLAQLPPLSDAEACYRGFFSDYDPKYQRGETQQAKLTAHEFAHSCKVGHISGDPIQSPSIQGGDWPDSFRGTELGRQLSVYFGGEPVSGGPVDPPPPVPTPGGVILVIDDNAIRVQINGVLRPEKFTPTLLRTV